jgi:dolichol kinase
LRDTLLNGLGGGPVWMGRACLDGAGLQSLDWKNRMNRFIDPKLGTLFLFYYFLRARYAMIFLGLICLFFTNYSKDPSQIFQFLARLLAGQCMGNDGAARQISQ